MTAVTLERVFADNNLFEAWAKVRANQGCAGVDGFQLTHIHATMKKRF